MMNENFIFPTWPAPANVRSIQTTRNGGVSKAPFDSLNLAMHVHDDGADVQANRYLLQQHIPNPPIWLNQIHGTHVIDAAQTINVPDADAAFSRKAGVVCCVMTADCLPVLFCDNHGSVVASAHAGWRGLSAGVLESTVTSMQVAPHQLMAWLGPAIGSSAFEVGDDVRQTFLQQDADYSAAFVSNGGRKWLADLYLLARLRLAKLGITQVYGGGFCTYQDSTRFFSYRRDAICGRMATLIWLQA